jgi:hypothetical protein
MVLVGDKARVEAQFGPFGGSANLMQDRCMVCTERTTGTKSFWTHPIELLGDVGRVKSHFGPFGDSVSVDAR